MPLLHATRGFWSIGRPLELPYAPGSSCTAQPRAHGSKFQLHPSSWAQVEPVLRLRLTSPEVLQASGRPRCNRRAHDLPLHDHD